MPRRRKATGDGGEVGLLAGSVCCYHDHIHSFALGEFSNEICGYYIPFVLWNLVQEEQTSSGQGKGLCMITLITTGDVPVDVLTHARSPVVV